MSPLLRLAAVLLGAVGSVTAAPVELNGRGMISTVFNTRTI